MSELLRRAPRFIAALALLAVVAGCAVDGEARSEPAVGPGSTEFTMTLRDMEFVPAEFEVPAGEVITIKLTNEGHARHDLMLETGYHSPVVEPGGRETIEIGPFETGTYEGICTITGHREAGMVLEVTAR